MPATYTCDVCGAHDADPYGYDGDVLCAYHATQSDLAEAVRERDELSSWLANTHHKTLSELNDKIATLRAQLVDPKREPPGAVE